MENTISTQLEQMETITLNGTVGLILYWGLLAVAIAGIVAGLFGPAIKGFLVNSRTQQQPGRFKAFIGGSLRFLVVAVGVCAAVAFLGAIHTMEFVDTNEITIAEDGSLEQGAYIIPQWNPNPRFVMQRSSSFARKVSGQIDPETGSRVDLNLTWEYRIADAEKASALYPILRTHGTIEAYTDWQLAAIVKNPNSLEGLQEAVTGVCKELDACGVQLRVQAQETHTHWRQYDAGGVRIAEQNEQPEAQY